MPEVGVTVRQALLKHGLDMEGHVEGSFLWERPMKIYLAVNLYEAEFGACSCAAPKAEIRRTSVGRYCSIGPLAQRQGSAHPAEWLSTHPFPYQNPFEELTTYQPPLTFEGYSRLTIPGHARPHRDASTDPAAHRWIAAASVSG